MQSLPFLTPWTALYPRGIYENRASFLIFLPDYKRKTLSSVDHSPASLSDGTEFAQINSLRI
jgi:hypothetical protein